MNIDERLTTSNEKHNVFMFVQGSPDGNSCFLINFDEHWMNFDEHLMILNENPYLLMRFSRNLMKFW